MTRSAARPVSVSVLRATKVHEFAEQLLRRVRGPVAVLPRAQLRRR